MERPRLPAILAPLLAVLLALILRTWQLGGNPPGFFRDEADKGYTAYSLLHTGRDLSGAFLPLFVKSFAVYTTGLYQYLTIPFAAALGLTETATRLPAALAGTATVLALFLLMSRLFDRRTGLIAALLLAFSPWHLLFSRWANQGILMPLFITLALYSLVRMRDSNAPRHLYYWAAASAVAFGLALYSYEPAKALIPLLVPLSLLLLVPGVMKKENRRLALLVLVIILALALPMIAFHIQQSSFSQARFNRISVFHGGASIPVALGRFIANFAAHLSPEFLFAHGDANLRHNFGGSGVFHRLDAVLLLLALIETFRTRKPALLLLWSWFLLGFVPASLTQEGIPHALRSIGGLAAGVSLAGRGAAYAWESLAAPPFSPALRRILALAAPALYGIVLIAFLWGAFRAYPVEPEPNAAWSAGWGRGVKACAILAQEQGWPPLRTVYIDPPTSAEFPHIFFEFYLPADPAGIRTRGVYPKFKYPEGQWKVLPSLMEPGDAVLYCPEITRLPLDAGLRWGIVTIRAVPGTPATRLAVLLPPSQ